MADQNSTKSDAGVLMCAATATSPQDAMSVPKDAYANAQLALFQSFLTNSEDQRSGLSNAVPLWDSIPRYSIPRQRMNSLRTAEGFLDVFDLSFTLGGRTIIARIHPARVITQSGKRLSYYPGEREEIIEHALRRLATEQNSGFFDSPSYRSGVRFSLHQLRSEIARCGHTMRYDQLKEGLDVLSGSTIEIIAENADGEKAFAKSAYLVSLTGITRREYDSDRSARWTCQFHPLITQAIDRVTYRQFNYDRLMKCTTRLSRWLFTQLVLKYTQAAVSNTFDMRFSTIHRDSAQLSGYARIRDAITAVDEAFEQQKSLGTLLHVKKTELRGRRKKIEDVVYTLYPSPEFVREQKAANRRASGASAEPAACSSDQPAGPARASLPRTAGPSSGPQALDRPLADMAQRLRKSAG